jgi:ABC-2 type transport system permease protein
MRAAIIIAAKDIKERVRDRSAIILAIVVPLGLAFILNATLSGITDETFETRIAVHDADAGPVAEGFWAVMSSVEDRGFATVAKASTESAARFLVDDDEVAAAILIPSGFSAAVEANEPAELVVVTNPDDPIGADVAQAIVTGYAEEINAVRLSVATALGAGATVDPTEIDELVAAAQGRATPVVLQGIEAEESGFDIATFFAMGIAVFFLFFTVQFGILSLIDERETGTMTRLLAAPIRKQSILLGKLLAAFVIGVAATVVLWLATTLLMGASWGNGFGVLLLIITGVAAAMGLTAAVAMSANTAEQAGAITAFIVVLFGILGGVFFPINRASGLLSVASRLTPHFWLMDGFQDLSAGSSVGAVLPAAGAVLLFAVVLGAIGLWRANAMVAKP